MSDPSKERDEAVGQVLSDIAGACLSIRALAVAVIDTDDQDEAQAMLFGIDALAARVGALADRAGQRVSKKLGGVQSPDEWAHPPRTRQALMTLEGDHEA